MSVVRLPVTGIQEVTPQLPADALSPVARKVLVVDDNRDAVESLVAVLVIEGHDVTAAYDGKEAITVGEQVKPVDMDVLLDMLTTIEHRGDAR